MDIRTAQICKSVVNFEIEVKSSSGKETYKVIYGRVPQNLKLTYAYEYGWSCTCKGFTYHGKCKHIEVGKQSRCGWNEECSPTFGYEEKCPGCGGPMESIQVSV